MFFRKKSFNKYSNKKITETSKRRTGFVANIPNTKDYNLKEVNRKKIVKLVK